MRLKLNLDIFQVLNSDPNWPINFLGSNCMWDEEERGNNYYNTWVWHSTIGDGVKPIWVLLVWRLKYKFWVWIWVQSLKMSLEITLIPNFSFAFLSLDLSSTIGNALMQSMHFYHFFFFKKGYFLTFVACSSHECQ